MLNGLLNRLLSKSKPPHPSTRAAATPASSAPGPRPVVERAAAAAPAGVGARRPLVSANGGLAGFEFHAAALDPRRIRRADDPAVAAAYTGNVLGAMRLCTSQGLSALAELPATWLMRCERDDLFTPGMHLLVRTDPAADQPASACALATRLRALGVQVGWDPTNGDALAPAAALQPDFVPLRAPGASNAQAWQRGRRALARRTPRAAGPAGR